MQKNDSIPQYISRFTQYFDELVGAGFNVAKDYLAIQSLLGLPKSWHSYQDLINGREKLPNWECLWSDLVQEEIRKNTIDGTSSKCEDEENFGLGGKERKGKGEEIPIKTRFQSRGKKKDQSKIKCFNCHEFRQTNSGNNTLGGLASEALASQFELHFTLITCMAIKIMGNVWYLNNGASFHMTCNKYFFSDLEDKYLHMNIDMGDDGRYSARNIGEITFQRDSGSPLRLKDVMFISGPKENIISVVMLEYHGYKVI